MQIQNGKVILSTEPCYCGDGTQNGHRTCSKCNGTSKGPRGKIGGCRACYRGKVVDPTVRVPCDRCNGTTIVPEDRFSTRIPVEVWQTLTFKVYRQDRGISWNESHLGAGCVYSCSDYGNAWDKLTDAQIIDEVKKSTGHQVCKLTREDCTICDHIAIIVNRGGYSVRAAWEPNATNATDKATSEPSESRGMAIGIAVANAGGHGTLAAAGLV